MNIYNLSRDFWNFAFDNSDVVKPAHIAMYFFAIEHCNRLGWKQKFGLPASMTMEAIGIKSYRLYKKTFDDLVEWKMFQVHEYSKNQYSSNIIALDLKAKAQSKALDNAMQKHGTKQVKSTGESNSESTDQRSDSINKPITKNKEQKAAPALSVSELKEMFDVFRKKHGGKGKRSLDVEFEHFKKKHKDWREVIPKLPDIIDKHIEYRKKLESAGEFVANWKNFSTWVNNRCWTEELDPIESKTTSNGQLPIDFKPEVEYFIQGKGGVEKMVNKETRLTITGHARKEYRNGEMRYADEQGREITEQEYNEKIQLQTH